jgi:hypothetical protein
MYDQFDTKYRKIAKQIDHPVKLDSLDPKILRQLKRRADISHLLETGEALQATGVLRTISVPV